MQPSVQTSTSPGAACGRWPGSDLDRRRGLTAIWRDSTNPGTRKAARRATPDAVLPATHRLTGSQLTQPAEAPCICKPELLHTASRALLPARGAIPAMVRSCGSAALGSTRTRTCRDLVREPVRAYARDASAGQASLPDPRRRRSRRRRRRHDCLCSRAAASSRLLELDHCDGAVK
jgi:hypothetical protein